MKDDTKHEDSPAAPTVRYERFEGGDVDERFLKRIAFIVEIDRLKQVFRQSYLMDSSRRENDAEHSWHLATMAVLLADFADEPVDLLTVIKMVLVHDLVEIDAGDTFCYDLEGHRDKAAREQAAADRLFALLPADQGAELRGLWEQFEARTSPEARFAAALDRLQPLLCNYATGGRAWREHGVRKEMILQRNAHIAEGSGTIWRYARAFIDDAARRGWIAGEDREEKES